MVAVGIMAIIMSIGLPAFTRNMHQDSMRKAVQDVMEVCSDPRARAILNGIPMELRIRPAERGFSVAAVSGSSEDESMGPKSGLPDRVDYKWGDRMVEHPASTSESASLSVKLSSSIIIEGLGVNGEDWTEDAEARVRFYPNGTSDQMSIVLLSDKGERRNIWLEVVTGMAEFEVDPLKFRVR